ncbi:EamA family transporter [Synoicihabitans lomoniglobus]|uniref:EamA family transporter n=1 Tax=Synoicihabitans lomoniglobus TaxID=2909285 RepID=A0AAF0CPE6_9BACT|nr:EamA family transporter [Opitutaceae bacterium LMO-M01]WED64339.1 EamA family transporter [Opitutaceae bacterium LMO-M01]
MPVTSAQRSAGLLVVAALFWSTGGLLIKHIDWPPLAVAGGRGLFAALFLIVAGRRWSLRWTRVQWIGAACYATCTVAFCAATKLTTAANAILLQYTAPVWIALFGAWFLGERATRLDWATIVAVLGGMVVFLANGLSVGHLLGDTLGLIAGLGFAAMTIALRYQKDASPLDCIILGNLLAFVVGLPWIVDAPALSGSGALALVTLGVVQLGIPYLMYAYAIRHVTALQAVLIPVIEPLLNPVWVLLALGEKPTPLALVGGAIVLAAVTGRSLFNLSRRTARRPDVRETVVLLHGLGLGGWAMARLARSLRADDYRVINLTYRSRSMPVEQIGAEWLPAQLRRHGIDPQDPAVALHCVTHSMGGLVVRRWLQQHGAPTALRRVVMIAPPNHGTALVDRIGHWLPFRWFTGVNGRRLGTGPHDVPARLGPWPAGPELGIIAGDMNLNPWLASLTGHPGDGKVTIASTRLDGMHDHIVLPHSHTWLQYRREPIAQVHTFLRHGRFAQ